jgi:hypothetical protein
MRLCRRLSDGGVTAPRHAAGVDLDCGALLPGQRNRHQASGVGDKLRLFHLASTSGLVGFELRRVRCSAIDSCPVRRHRRGRTAGDGKKDENWNRPDPGRRSCTLHAPPQARGAIIEAHGLPHMRSIGIDLARLQRAPRKSGTGHNPSFSSAKPHLHSSLVQRHVGQIIP